MYELFIGTTCCILVASASQPPSTVMLSHPDITLMCYLCGAKANGALGRYVGKLFCPLFSSNMRNYGIRNISLYYSMDTSNNDIRKTARSRIRFRSRFYHASSIEHISATQVFQKAGLKSGY